MKKTLRAFNIARSSTQTLDVTDKALNKDSLLKATIRTMGYASSSTALLAAAERGLKYGRKTGEIVQDAEKRFMLSS